MTERINGGAESADDLDGTVQWRVLLAETEQRLASGGVRDAPISARRIVEEAAGADGAALFAVLDELATVRGVARLDAMVERRLTGEPLQYVVGRWGFRTLDLAIDRRVLIPRPETEEVAGWAMAEIDRLAETARLAGPSPRAVDLGTGSGAIGLAILAERSSVEVWMTDRSADAVAVASANLAGLGRPATRGRVAVGSWFDALPVELRGAVDVIVSNPPYVAAADALPAEVGEWEPLDALVADEDGLADLQLVVDEAPRWLSPAGALILELAPTQATVIAERASEYFVDVEIRADLSGRQRAVVARTPSV